jgi:hypothetical protein
MGRHQAASATGGALYRIEAWSSCRPIDRKLMADRFFRTDVALGVNAGPVYAAAHGKRTFASGHGAGVGMGPFALFGGVRLSVLALAAMIFVGRRQNAVRQREENRRRTALRNDIRDP